MDFAEEQGTKFLVYTDWKSGWFVVRKMRDTDAPPVIKELMPIFSDTAVPQMLFSDNGPPFNSRETMEFYRKWGIKWISSSPRYPQSNSIAEDGVKSAKALLRKCMNNGKLDLDAWARGLLQIGNTPNRVTGISSL